MRNVTEADFRMPEFRDAKVEDYEFRLDGKLVRKDRWQNGIHRMVSILGQNNRDFEIVDVLDILEDFVERATEAGIPIVRTLDMLSEIE